jgi:phosphoglycerate dehydrogenase-like enzyme
MTRGIPQATAWKSERYWGRGDGYRALREIKDATMGIVGYGAIGRAVAKRARAFEMDVLAVDARPGPGDAAVADVWPVSRLHELLGKVDVAVIAAPLTQDSRNMIDAKAIGAMRQDAYLIAISRGGIVDEAALADALLAGRLAGAGLDVTEQEPLPADSPLWAIPNLILTPHVAGASRPKERRCVEIFRENLTRYVNGAELINVVDKRAGY